MYEYLDINEVKAGSIVEFNYEQYVGGFTHKKLYIVKGLQGISGPAIIVEKDDNGSTTNGMNKHNWKLVKTRPGSEAKIEDKVFCNANVKPIGQDWVIGKIYTIATEVSASGNCRARESNWNDVRNFVVLVEDSRQFNPRILSEPIIVSCKTEEQAKKLLEWANENGKRWQSGDRFTQFTNWPTHSSDTCYTINQGLFHNVEYHNIYKQNIWSYEDALCININN